MNLSRREFFKQVGGLAGTAWGLRAAAPAEAKGAENAPLQEARFYTRLGQGDIQCQLCPWGCRVSPNERGRCGARENRGGTYYSMVYAKVCAHRLDPIEKNPLYHVAPGTKTLALATAGCNMHCKFCQSWQMAQSWPEDTNNVYLPPQQAVELARQYRCGGIAYTYTEPVNFIEYAADVADAARQAGLWNVCHTAGFINPEPLRYLCSKMDAINVDLKGFTDTFYQEVCAARLQPVLETIKNIRRFGAHLELTYLVLPTLNDKPAEVRQMCEWIKRELGADTPIHFTRFYPEYRLKNLPATPVKTLEDIRKVAFESGLRYTYIGNIPGHGGESTYCPKCGMRLVWRVNFQVRENLIRKGKCPGCGLKIPGLWG